MPEQVKVEKPPTRKEEIAEQVHQREWSRRQRHITDVSTALTAAGAASLGGLLAGKTRAGKKVLPKRVFERLTSSQADDLRNAIAVAGMTSGVVSGVNWSKKLREDERKPITVRADNLAKAWRKPGLMRTVYGRTVFRNAAFTRPRIRGTLRPRRLY